MRGLIPVLILILGLSAREYADRHIPGGLEHADLHAIVQLVQETAETGVETVLPSRAAQHERRTVYRVQRRHRRHVNRARSRETVRTRVRIRDGKASYQRVEQPLEIVFVVPAENERASMKRRHR
jgi:hypothetical protein